MKLLSCATLIASGLITGGCERQNGAKPLKIEETKPLEQIYSRATNSFGEIGRFQIVSCIITRGDEKQNVVMKIDTTTGKSWRWEVWILSGPVAAEGWVENKLFDDSLEVARALSEKLKAEKEGKDRKE